MWLEVHRDHWLMMVSAQHNERLLVLMLVCAQHDGWLLVQLVHGKSVMVANMTRPVGALGAVIFDRSESHLAALPVHLATGLCDPTAAGLLAIIHGLRAALLAGYRRPLLTSDCPAAVQLVTGWTTTSISKRSDLWALGQIATALLEQFEVWLVDTIWVDQNDLARRYAVNVMFRLRTCICSVL
jgi:ribonuclease HI